MQLRQLIIGQRYKAILSSNKEISEQTIWIPDNPYVDERIAGHVDLSIFKHNGIIYADNYLKGYLNIKNCKFIDGKLSKKYPNDFKFNACSVGKFVFLNEKYVSHEILDDLQKQGSSIINVNQGYCNCNILVLNNYSIITSDPSIYEKSLNNNINVLKIHNGYISLPGFEYGFIGGSGFMSDYDLLLLTGSIESHPDKDSIIRFCLNIGINIEYLTNNNIFDIGGAIKAE